MFVNSPTYLPSPSTGFIISHPLDRSASLFVVLKGYCLSVDNNGFIATHGPGTTVGLSGLWFGRTLTTVVSKTYVDGFFIPGAILNDALESKLKSRKLWVDVYLRTLPALHLCEEYLLYSTPCKEKEEIIQRLILKYHEYYSLKVSSLGDVEC